MGELFLHMGESKTARTRRRTRGDLGRQSAVYVSSCPSLFLILQAALCLSTSLLVLRLVCTVFNSSISNNIKVIINSKSNSELFRGVRYSGTLNRSHRHLLVVQLSAELESLLNTNVKERAQNILKLP